MGRSGFDTSEMIQSVSYDAIMLKHGLADEDTILFALENQDKTCEFYVDHLCRTGQVDRQQLLEALAKELGHRPVDLETVSVPPEVTKLMAEEDAHLYLTIPFQVDQENKVVDLASVNPTDNGVAQRMEGLFPDMTARFHICLPNQILDAISSLYAQERSESESSPPTERLAAVTDDSRGSLLFVTSFPPSDRLMCRSLASEGWTVFVMNSTEEALDVIRNHRLNRVLIRVESGTDYSTLMQESAAICPELPIRTYTSIGDVTTVADHRSCQQMLTGALTLLRQTALAESDRPPSSRAVELCRAIAEKLTLPQQEQMILNTCAHLYDLHEFFLGEVPESGDPKKLIRMIASGLESLDYATEVVSVLRRLYDTNSKPEEPVVVAASILTLVDFCLERWPEVPFLDEVTFASLKKTVSDQVGTLFREDIATAFLELIQAHVIQEQAGNESCRVLLLCPPGMQTETVDTLRNSGCESIVKATVHEFVSAYRQGHVDVLVISLPGSPELVMYRVNNLIARGVIFDQIPTLVLVDHRIMSHLADLYHHGIEDICPVEGNSELLKVKVERIRQRLATERDHRHRLIQGLGTHGSLSDMNVIDLLQAMRSSEKTALISVTALGEQLTVYISGGNLVYAKSGELEGPEAVFGAIRWRQGVWSIEPVAPQDLPEPNNTRSIDAVLIEGCTMMDETNQQRSQTDGDAVEIDFLTED